MSRTYKAVQVRRLGFGAMRLTGKGIWGEPECIAVLRRAVDLGINTKKYYAVS